MSHEFAYGVRIILVLFVESHCVIEGVPFLGLIYYEKPDPLHHYFCALTSMVKLKGRDLT